MQSQIQLAPTILAPARGGSSSSSSSSSHTVTNSLSARERCAVLLVAAGKIISWQVNTCASQTCFFNRYCRIMHPVARTIKAVKIKPSFATTVRDIYYVPITISTCFDSFNGNLQVISHNIKC
jgi:hypothetical protein